MEGTTITVTAILELVGQFFAWMLGSMTDLSAWIATDPFAMIYVSLFIGGAVIGFLFRVLNKA